MDDVDMKKLKIAIIGSGMGRYGLLPAFLMDSRTEIVAVCTSKKDTAEKFANQFGIPAAYDDWQRLLQHDIDILAIATPPQTQTEITMAALEKKIPLFLEKQIAINPVQSKKMCELAKTYHVATCVNFIFPALKTWQLAKSYLEQGKLGDIRHVFLNWRMESFDNRCRTPNIWKTNDNQGGGILQHFLSHSFHYLEWFFGEVSELQCVLRKTADLGFNGSVFASLDLIFKNNIVVHIAASSAAFNGPGHSLEMYGSEGSLILKNESNDPVSGFELYYASRQGEKKLIDAETKYCSSKRHDSRVFPTGHIIKNFIDALSGKPINHPTIQDGHRVQVLLNSANIANSKNSFVTI